jgi:hypothetical protein
MGADLIVNILVGPDKFSPAKVQRAKDFARKVVAEAKLVHKRQSADLDFKMDKESTENSNLRFMLSYEQYDSIDDACICIENLAALKPAQFVNEFIQWWRSCSGRDTAGRSMPFKKDWKIVVCGETCNGMSPDGYGYSTVRTAEWLNVVNILGIR